MTVVDNNTLVAETAAGLFAQDNAPDQLVLNLVVSDPEVIAELARQQAGSPRVRYALTALRIGTLCLRQASGELDTDAVKRAGGELLAELRELMTARAADMNNTMVGALAHYFDAETGLVHQRMQSLVAKDGELDRILAAHLSGNESVLARTLAAHLGDSSPLFEMLSPDQANGLRAQLAATIEAMITEHREHLVGQFSLDNKESALSRLVGEIETRQAKLGHDVKGQIALVVKEFSLDHPDSGLSRMAELLATTRAQIDKHLTLDDDSSALARLRREITTGLESLTKRNVEFQTEVREAVAALQARKQEATRGTGHGLDFEDELGTLVAELAARGGDIYEHCGNNTGTISHCKVGDHTVELGPESQAAGARIVWEAKQDGSHKLTRALAEIDKARKNRQAQVGVFVYSARSAPAEAEPFARYGDTIVIVWDAEDPSTDVYVKAAYSVARALTVRAGADSEDTAASIHEIELAARAIEKQIKHVSEIHKWATTINNNSAKIVTRAERMRDDLARQIERIDEQVRALGTERA